MESAEKNHDESESHSSLTHEEKYLTASYAALMAEMEKEDEYDYEENDDDCEGQIEINHADRQQAIMAAANFDHEIQDMQDSAAL